MTNNDLTIKRLEARLADYESGEMFKAMKRMTENAIRERDEIRTRIAEVTAERDANQRAYEKRIKHMDAGWKRDSDRLRTLLTEVIGRYRSLIQVTSQYQDWEKDDENVWLRTVEKEAHGE